MDLCAFGDRAAALSPARRLFDPPGQFFVTLRDFAHHPSSLGVLHGFGSGQDFLGAVSRLPCEEQKPFGYCWHWRPPTAAKNNTSWGGSPRRRHFFSPWCDIPATPLRRPGFYRSCFLGGGYAQSLLRACCSS